MAEDQLVARHRPTHHSSSVPMRYLMS
jgi:hypothetical protein